MILVRVLSATFKVIGVVALAGLLAACDSPTSPSSAPFSQTDLRLGTGAPAANGNVLTVHYTGWLYNPAQPDEKGAQFDSSVGGTPFSFALGTGGVISGWDVGLVGIRVGGVRRLVIPPSLSYGGSRSGPIPPNATLLFEVELVELITGS